MTAEAVDTHYRTCHLCEAMCGVAIEHRGGEILGIRGDDADVLGRGHVCPKAVALEDLHLDPDRLRRPVKRVGDRFVEIEWSEAFDLVESGVKRIWAAHGRDAVGLYIGNPTAHQPGALLMLAPFLLTLRTANRFSASSVDQLAVMFASHEMFGNAALTTVPDLDRTDFLLMLGANPAASGGSLMSAGDVMGRIRDVRSRGGKVVVVDPRRTETAAKADRHVFIRPGGDVFMLAAMLQVIFAERRVALGRLEAFTQGLDELERAVSPFTPELVAEITGVRPDELRALAREFASARRAVCYGRFGSNVQEFGGLTAWLINALNVVTGNLDREGGAMFTQPAIDLVGMAGASGIVRGLSAKRTRVSGLPIFAGEKPVSALAEEMLTDGEGKIRALFTHAGNPVLSTPNGKRLDEALASLELMVSIDLYVNETTRHAHVILPPTGPLEHGHFDVLLNSWAVRNVVKYSPPLFSAPEGTLHDWQIFLELIVRLSARTAVDRALYRRLARVIERLGMEGMIDLLLRTGPYGPRSGIVSHLDEALGEFFVTGRPYRALRAAASKLVSRSRVRHFVDAMALVSERSRGLDLAAVAAQPHGVDLGPLQQALPRRLFTADHRLKLAPPLFVGDLPRALTKLRASQRDGTMLLIGRRHLRSNNSWMHNSKRLMRGRNRCTAMLHPEDASRLGVDQGAIVRVTSRVGTIELPAEITEQIMPGVISVPHGFGHDREGVKLEVAQRHAGTSVNDITDERHVDSLTGVTALNGLPVQVSLAQLP
jgi:anaerobic selenocysteine-containing dehydrogenase